MPAFAAAEAPALSVGLAVRDVTPELPIWQAGYAARKRPADKIDHPLLVQALAFRNPSGEQFIFVGLDNCEVSRSFNEPALQELEKRHGLRRGEVMIVSSHTHAGPVLAGPLDAMYGMPAADRERVARYGEQLQGQIVEVVGAALADLQPATLEHGVGRATFAMNRRAFREDQVALGENPDGPVDWDVPVLRIKGTNLTVRAVVFGYACHATTIHGDDFYTISPDYIGYARTQIEAVLPGTVAMFLTGMGADANPSPRGTLLDSKRHGLELAGAVMSVLNRPMRPLRGPLKFACAELELPLEAPPGKEQLEKDAQSPDVYVRKRAAAYLERLAQGQPLPAVRLSVAAVRLGHALTFLAMGGEVVVDYALCFKRVFAEDHPWTIGYAYDVPCYIPSVRVLREGGYEAQSSLVYYGVYGPFKPVVEQLLVNKMGELLAKVR